MNTNVLLLIEQRMDEIQLTITDSCCGFDVQAEIEKIPDCIIEQFAMRCAIATYEHLLEILRNPLLIPKIPIRQQLYN